MTEQLKALLIPDPCKGEDEAYNRGIEACIAALSASSKPVEPASKPEVARKMMEFYGKTTYLSHPDVPYFGTENGDTREKWEIRLWSAIYDVAICRLDAVPVTAPVQDQCIAAYKNAIRSIQYLQSKHRATEGRVESDTGAWIGNCEEAGAYDSALTHAVCEINILIRALPADPASQPAQALSDEKILNALRDANVSFEDYDQAIRCIEAIRSLTQGSKP